MESMSQRDGSRLRPHSFTPIRRLGVVLTLLVSGGVVGVTSQQFASADLSTGERPVFVAITPCRLADTRPAPNTIGPRSMPIGGAESVTIAARGSNGDCTIPADAVALSLNVTALGATEQTFLTIWPDGARPLAASLNPSPGAPPTPNAVNAPLSPSGSFDIYNDRGSVHVVLDVNGYYVHHDHDDRYYTEAEVDALLATVTTTAPTTTTSTTTTTTTTTTTQPAPPVEAQHPALVYGRPVRSDVIVNSSGNAKAFSDVEIDPLGRVHVAWIDGTTDSAMVSRCVDLTCSGAPAVAATGISSASSLLDMELDSAGDPVLFTGYTGTVSVTTCLSFCVGGNTTSFPAIARSGGLTLTRDDLPIIVYENDVSANIEITSCLDRLCTASTTSTLAPTGNLASVDVILGRDGYPIVAYSNLIDQELVVLSCRTVDCVGSPAPVKTVLDTIGNTSSGVSITLDADGHPVMAYRDLTNNATKTARCNNPTCSGADPATITVLPSADDSTATDIAISSATGFPIVVSWVPTDANPARFQAEICLDVDCATSDIHILHGGAPSTERPRVTIGATGVPIVSWIDPVSAFVMVSHLGGGSSTPNGWD